MKKKVRVLLQSVLSVLILSLFLNGCQSLDPVSEVIDLSDAMKTNGKLNLSDYCEKMWYIHPEYRADAIPGTYNRVKIVNKKLIIVDRTDRIFVYDLDGKLLQYLHKKGRGPGEYYQISDISSYGNYLYILNYNTSILQYSLDGDFVKEIKLESYHNCLDIIKERIYLYAVPPYTLHNDDYKITVLSPDLKIESRMHRYPINPENEAGYSLHTFINMYNYKDTVSFFEKGFDKIYRICGNQIMCAYEFKVPNNGNKTIKEQFDDVNYTQINGLLETPKYLYIRGIQERRRRTLLISKERQEGVNLIFNLSIIDSGFHNDIDGGYPFWPRGQADTGELFTWFDLNSFWLKYNDPYFSKMEITNPARAQEFRNMVETANDKVNPVIMVVKPH